MSERCSLRCEYKKTGNGTIYCHTHQRWIGKMMPTTEASEEQQALDLAGKANARIRAALEADAHGHLSGQAGKRSSPTQVEKGGA